MRYLFDLTHPVHVHMFRGLIRHLEDGGNQVLVVARDKDVTIDLLEDAKIRYTPIGNQSSGYGLAREWLGRNIRILRMARSFDPDLLIGESNPLIAQVGRLLGKRSIIFLDTEHAYLQNSLIKPFSDVLCTPQCYPKDLGPGQVRFRGFKELAYLHPSYFTPDPGILEKLGLAEGETFTLIRSVSWSAAHDMGHSGLGNPLQIAESLDKYGRVFISSEGPIPESCQKYALNTGPARIHDVLSQASLYIGDGASMAAEASILGIPSVFASSLRLRYLDYLEKEYRLVYQVDVSRALEHAEIILQNPASKDTWNTRRRAMLDDTVDVNRFMIELVEKTIPGTMTTET